jgi:hypothetical protein
MWTKAHVKCPDTGEWVALTRVSSEGETRPQGYLLWETLAWVAESLRPLLEMVPETGHPDGHVVEAWSDFVHWADQNLPRPVVLDAITIPPVTRLLDPDDRDAPTCDECGREPAVAAIQIGESTAMVACAACIFTRVEELG